VLLLPVGASSPPQVARLVARPRSKLIDGINGLWFKLTPRERQQRVRPAERHSHEGRVLRGADRSWRSSSIPASLAFDRVSSWVGAEPKTPVALPLPHRAEALHHSWLWYRPAPDDTFGARAQNA